jgi:hypothetical protein
VGEAERSGVAFLLSLCVDLLDDVVVQLPVFLALSELSLGPVVLVVLSCELREL